MRQRASIRDYQAWAEGRLFAGRPADDHWMNSPSSGQHTAHYSPVIIAPFVAWGRRGSLPLFSGAAGVWRHTPNLSEEQGMNRPGAEVGVAQQPVQPSGERISAGGSDALECY